METLPTSHENEPNTDPGLDLGEVHLSFSELPTVDFRPKSPEETDEEFAERVKGLEQRKFIGFFLAQEKGGPEAVEEAFKMGDFKITRAQKREFIEAISYMPPEEYEARINALLEHVSENQDAYDTTVNQADNIWHKACELARQEIEATKE